MMTAVLPPGPKPSLGFSLKFIRTRGAARLQMIAQLQREYGDLVHTHVGRRHIYLVSRPAFIHEVLVNVPEKVHKGPGLKRNTEKTIGQGLLTVEGEKHRQQRKLMQPAFHSARIANYATSMVEYTERLLTHWQTDQQVDIHHEMMTLTRDIVAKTLFDADVRDKGDVLAEAITVQIETLNERASNPLHLPDWVPTPKNRRRQAMLTVINAATKEFINTRRASGADTGDLLSMMLIATDEDNGGKLSARELRDNVLTLFVAGHETTANALTWAWYLLAQHPEAAAKLRAEVDSVLGGRASTVQDLARLPYTDMVIKEAMRVYPPVWITTREVIEPITLGEYTLEKGNLLLLSPYLMHHDARYFPDPERFDPERWAGDFEKNLPRGAYFPFGGGPRVCIGQPFAMMEARLILATMAARFDLALLPGQYILPDPIITLRPNNPIQMQVKQRESAGMVNSVVELA